MAAAAYDHDRDRSLTALADARRMVDIDRADGTVFPGANGPLQWTRAAAIAQVESAESLERIADALETLVRMVEDRPCQH